MSISGTFIYITDVANDNKPEVRFNDIILNTNSFNYIDETYACSSSNSKCTVTVDFTYTDNNSTQDGLKVGFHNIEITQWGGIPLARAGVIFEYFPGSISVTSSTDLPTILSNTSFDYLFNGSTINNDDFGNIEYWDVSNVISMNSTFKGCTNFNKNIRGWNVNSNLTDVTNIFQNATALLEGDYGTSTGFINDSNGQFQI